MRIARRCLRALIAGGLALAPTAVSLTAQGGRPHCALDAAIGSAVDSGWRAMRASRLADADSQFRAALARCAHFTGALVGEGYVAMRRADDGAAESYFERTLTEQPENYDALAGLGMLAYRHGDLTASRRRFQAALRAVPRDSVSLWYLQRIPGGLDSLRLSPPEKPARTIVAARTGDRVLEVPNGPGGFTPLWVKAVNIGAALPGKHPSEFPPDDSTYERWLELIARMNANAIRVYTIHPPHFYRALARWNQVHPDHPLWLIQGVWTEPPPGRKEERYDDRVWSASFVAEVQRVVDLVHGSAVIPARPGHASGIYTTDLSRWTLAYIIGREWEPYSVVEYARLHPSQHSLHGRYLTIDGGNAVDVWLTRLADGMIGYEMDRYNEQRPIAYTNWPTLDPLAHPTESTLAQEDSIRRVRHETVPEAPKEYDNDAIGLDAVLVRPTAAFPAGVFASFHAYPYYPDFISFDRAYSASRSPEGPSNYYGYLRALVEHFGRMPVIISEYGVPSSRGVAHLQPQGWHHGGHSEMEQAEINARLTRDIYASGAAGAGLFSLIDEWFKKNWTVIDFEYPAERNRLWLNPLDPEQNYGVVAMRAGRKDSAIVIDGRGDDWKGRPIWYEGAAHASLPSALRLQRFSVASDEAYVYLRLDVGAVDWENAHYLIGIDTYSPMLGDAVLPYTHTRSPVGLEFVVDLHGPEGSHLLVDRPYDLYRDEPIVGSRPLAVEQVYNRPFRSMANAAGQYDSTTVITNRRRIGRDGTVYDRRGIDRDRLLFARQSDNSLADWYADCVTDIIEVRIPWGMLEVLDPSSRLVLHGSRSGEVAGVKTDGFRFVVESYDPHHPHQSGDRLPNGATAGSFGALPTWSWREWEEPRWYPELKPQFETMRRAFADIPNAPARLATTATDTTRKR
ncbi:MAG TPA: hypothetical protein VGJ18_27080 [Gemmatimonadaceae bacterium]